MPLPLPLSLTLALTEPWPNQVRELFLLGALDRDGGLTPLGAAMARLPIEPRLSRTLLRAAELGCLETTASVCAMVCGDEPFIRAGAAEAQQVRFRVRVNPIPVPIPSTNPKPKPNPNPKPKPNPNPNPDPNPNP